jgi:hypothetical protein
MVYPQGVFETIGLLVKYMRWYFRRTPGTEKMYLGTTALDYLPIPITIV